MSLLFDSDEERDAGSTEQRKKPPAPGGKPRPKFKPPANLPPPPQIPAPSADDNGAAAGATVAESPPSGDGEAPAAVSAGEATALATAGGATSENSAAPPQQGSDDNSAAADATSTDAGAQESQTAGAQQVSSDPVPSSTADDTSAQQQQQQQQREQFSLPPLPNAMTLLDKRGAAPAAQWNDSPEASTLFRPDANAVAAAAGAGAPKAEFMSSPVLANEVQGIQTAATPAQFMTAGVEPPQPPPVPAPVVVAPDPPLALQMPAPVQMPVSEISPTHVLQAQAAEGTAGLPTWEAFEELRRTLDESHGRLLSIHSEIAKSQVSHEEEASAYRHAAEEQLSRQRKELEALGDKYAEATANLDHVQGVLRRKTDEIMSLEQRLQDAAVQRAAVIQHAAHVDDKAKLAEKAKLAAEVRARELELSLEHATKLLTALRKQLNSANEDKTAALQKQYKLFEENRQQLIHFYSERETFVLAAFNDSISRSHAQLAERERAREQQVVAHWQNVSHAQLAELKSLVDENRTRADAHAREIADMKEKQEEDKGRWLLHLQNEIKLADERAADRQKSLVADLTKREREMSEREQKMRVQFAQAEQDAKMQLIQREAELKSTYDKLLEDLRRAYDNDRDKTVTGFREQLASIASQHLQNERELEKMHREKEKEMAARYRIAGYDADDQRQKSELESVTSKTTGTLLAKFEQYELREKERAETSRSRLLTGGGANAAAAGGAPVGGLPSATPSTASMPSLASTAEKAGPRKTQFSHISGFSGSAGGSSPTGPSEEKKE